MAEARKWVMEVSSDGNEELIRVLKLGGASAELKYIAMSKTDAKELMAALDWFESFRNGMVGVPAKPKPRRTPVKRKPLILELELEPPKRKPRKT